ncbi:MAG: hypothetical protein JOY64_03350 [Alphaproteobacteria bacterium]|nr:hypothetical protein [Alphaproteobacteria bacterium]
MIQDMDTVWLYAFSPNSGSPVTAYYTIYTSGGNLNGRPVYATVALNYLVSVDSWGAGAWIRDVTPPFGPPLEFHDFAVNSYFYDQTLSVTFGLSATAAEAYAQGNIFYF